MNVIVFVIGGLTGVMLAIPPADFVLHNSLFLIAHFHNVIIGGVLFGLFAGIYYWWPKAFGFRLDPFWGKVSFWCWLIGFWVAFTPLYVLGLMGVTRRMSHFEDPSLQIWFQIAALGAVLGPWLLGWSLAASAVLGLGMVLVGLVGDLLVSSWKRDVGVKDTGTLLPGQGGLLDRCDSLLFVAPWFWLTMQVLP